MSVMKKGILTILPLILFNLTISANTYISKLDGKGLVEYVTVKKTSITEEDKEGLKCKSEQEVVTLARLKEMIINNEDYGNICTSEIVDMTNLFREKPVNYDITQWDVSKVKSMYAIFYKSTLFNQPIGDWDVSNVTNMQSVFGNSAFNQPIGNWNVSNVTNMNYMFQNSNFNQNISSWNTDNVVEYFNLFNNVPMEALNKPLKFR